MRLHQPNTISCRTKKWSFLKRNRFPVNLRRSPTKNLLEVWREGELIICVDWYRIIFIDQSLCKTGEMPFFLICQRDRKKAACAKLGSS